MRPLGSRIRRRAIHRLDGQPSRGDWRSIMVVGLLWMVGILIAMGWFAIGWIARGHENRKYAESRLRSLANRAMEDQRALIEARAHWEAERVPRESPTVVNVY